MIDRVHHHAAHMRPPSSPASTSRFTARYVHVIDISYLSNCREAVFVNAPNFARRHFHQRVTALYVCQSRLLPRASRNLSTAARTQLDVMNVSTQRNGAKWQGISEVRRDIISGGDHRSHPKAVWRENVT